MRRKGGSPTGFGLLRAVFSSQLCQLLTTMPSLENRNKHHQRYQKKGSQGVQSSKHNSIDLAATSAVAIVRKTGLGGWARTNFQGERHPAAAFPSFSKRMDGPDTPVLRRAHRARALCSRETLIPAGLPASTLVTASRSARLRKPPLPQGGLGKECTLGQKLHLSLRRKGGSPTGFGLLRAVFSSQLCQLLTTMPPLENRNKHHQRYQKKGSPGFQSSGT